MTQDQVRRLERLLTQTYGRNYTRKFDEAGISIAALRFPQDLAKLTTKSELVADQAANPPWGTALSEPLERYTRYCQTSSTSGFPLRWLDTTEAMARRLLEDRVPSRAGRAGRPHLLSFFVRTISGFLAGVRGCPPNRRAQRSGRWHVEEVRLAMIEKIGATVVCCTPDLRALACRVSARNDARPLAESSVRVLIVAGELMAASRPLGNGSSGVHALSIIMACRK